MSVATALQALLTRHLIRTLGPADRDALRVHGVTKAELADIPGANKRTKLGFGYLEVRLSSARRPTFLNWLSSPMFFFGEVWIA